MLALFRSKTCATMTDSNRLLRAGIWAISAPLPKRQRVALRHRLRGALDNRRTLAADLVILSRAKSGRTWLRAILSRLYQVHYGLPERQLLEYDNFHRLQPAVPIIAMTHGHQLAEFAHHPRFGSTIRAKPTILLLRDPRDVAVSEYFQTTRRASAHKKELYGVNEGQSLFAFVMQAPLGLPAACAYLNHWRQALASWDRVLLLRYEDLRGNPGQEIARIRSFMGAPFTDTEIADAVAFTDFDALKTKERENYYGNTRLQARNTDDPDSFKVRRGKVGGYRDYFEGEQLALIDGYVAKHLDPALGYGPANGEPQA